ncbi:MAG TPA: CDP-archaeol synthase [Methylocella sp.]|nr:CDP-archaeol synthase [Methylocella sp.]
MLDLHTLAAAQIFFLVVVANGTPVIAKKILGTARPLDGGIILADGQPLFGASKTARGILLSVIAASLAAPFIGLSWTTGLLVGITAMAGDLLSSFIKRRMKLPPGSMALGLDQIPESLFPAAACRWVLPVSLLDILVLTAVFFVGELAASRALYMLNIRDRPY